MLAYYIVVTFLIPYVLSSPFSLDKDAIPVNIRLIQEIHSPRFKRSFQSEDGVTNLPDHLVFGVPVKEDIQAILRLKRAPLVPTITSSAKVNSSTLDMNTAVYTDVSHHSTMIVRREDENYSMQGTFYHSGHEWNLQPLRRSSRSSASHQLSPLLGKDGYETISFVGDTPNTKERNVMELKNPFIKFPRKKEDKPTQHIVEIAFIADYGDYSTWVDYVGSSNAVNEMQLWYTYVAESINIRYNTIKDKAIAIGTRTTILKIITDDAADDFIGDVNGTFDGGDGLDAMEAWVPGQVDIPSSDHYMLFTGLNIIGLAGIANVAAVCSARSVSITRNSFHAYVGNVAAHELGHGLWALHDDDEGCDDDDEFIMTASSRLPPLPENAGNLWRFSSCSIEKFKRFLRGTTCTLPENTSGENVLPPPEEGERAGQVLSLDDQCIHRFQNTTSFFCSRVHPDLSKICSGMYCFIPGTAFCHMVLPQEFSTCGEDKWCYLGHCVDKNPATPGPTKLSECFIKKWRTFFQCLRQDYVLYTLSRRTLEDVIKAKKG